MGEKGRRAAGQAVFRDRSPQKPAAIMGGAFQKLKRKIVAQLPPRYYFKAMALISSAVSAPCKWI
jgi:hypothetical protein